MADVDFEASIAGTAWQHGIRGELDFFDQTPDAMVDCAEAIRLGDGLDPNAMMGP